MGGSGSGGVFRPSELASLREEALRLLEENQNDAAINERLRQELAYINDRDVELIAGHIDTIQEVLGNTGWHIERLLFGGSVAKHTYVDGLSDVDALVILDDEVINEMSPSEVRNNFAASLSQALPQGNVRDIREGAMAVTLEYMDGTEIQLLPAVRTNSGLAVPSWDGESWSSIQPQAFARELTNSNQSLGGRVIPTVKLTKALIASNLGEKAVSGYHVEALALEAFDSYSGPRTPKAMVEHFLQFATERVLRPIRDLTGQSRYVDEHLGASNSGARQGLAQSLRQLRASLDEARSVDVWENLLN